MSTRTIITCDECGRETGPHNPTVSDATGIFTSLGKNSDWQVHLGLRYSKAGEQRDLCRECYEELQIEAASRVKVRIDLARSRRAGNPEAP